jgi:hypothetical protein
LERSQPLDVHALPAENHLLQEGPSSPPRPL